MLIHLTDRSLLRIYGADAPTFLQGIITNDVRLLESRPAMFSALLNPQGKFLHDFFLTRQGDDIILETEQRQLEGLVKLLTMYRLRAKVTFTPLPDWQVYADCPSEHSEGSQLTREDPSASLRDNNLIISFPDPRHPDMGMRFYAPAFFSEPTEPLEAYEMHRLQVGIPEGWKDAIYGRSFLLEMGYDKLHGVDFSKGCYVGQEVTARSRFRAELRKYLHRVTGKPPLPAFGAEISNSAGLIAGDMRSSHHGFGLAMIRHELLETGQTYYAEENEVKLAPLEWMNNT